MEERFDIRAPEMTTEEFLASLNTSGRLAEPHKKFLREFLGSCDMVKFARYFFPREEMDKSLDLAQRLVEETRENRVA